MNINQIKATTQKLIDGARQRAEEIQDKTNVTDKDELRISALEGFSDALETELQTLLEEGEYE